MRVLFTVWPSNSHLYPLVPFGWALQAAGHEVRVATMPSLLGAVGRTGMTAVSVGPEVDDLAAMSKQGGLAIWHEQRRWPADWPVRVAELDPRQIALLDALGTKSLRMADLMLGDLVDFARAWRPDLVVYDAGSLAGPVAAAAVGARSIGHMWGQVGLHRHEVLAGGDGYRPEFLHMFERFGTRPDPEPAWLDPCPPSLRLPGPDRRIPVRYVPYNGPGAAPAEPLRRGERSAVCVTWGLSAAKVHGPALPGFILAVLASLTELDVDVVLATTVAADLLGDLPAGVRVLTSVPLRTVLPECAAIVHQGGGGTTLTSLWSGVPQLVISPRPEQMATGERIAAAGAGAHHPYNEIAPMADGAQRIRDDVAKLVFDASYQAAAQDLRSDMAAQPTPAAIVAELADSLEWPGPR